ncbi:MAG: site-specific DNA-methyltransferase, partial [Chloroflexi bacterium]|nr:site-specific DNA-methyltransferase [Chloroflexota bacterium]
MTGRLFYGDCFGIMQDEFRLSSVDLIYMDPPFNSNRQYNAIYRDETGNPLPDQIDAFCDMWTLDAEREHAIRTMPIQMQASGIDSSAAELWRLWLHALRHTQPRLLAYLSYMAERLLVMYRILKPTGSLYFHCDPTVSHYVKPLLDAIFGHGNFRNEIVWKRTSAQNDAKALGRAHDTIFIYAKDVRRCVWNRQYQAYDPAYIKSHYRHEDSKGRRFRTDNLTATGLSGGGYEYEWNGVRRVWRSPRSRMEELESQGRIRYTRNGTAEYIRYLDEMPGVALQDVWTDVPPINSQAKERMGYATQKPLALMERIIAASSNPGGG